MHLERLLCFAAGSCALTLIGCASCFSARPGLVAFHQDGVANDLREFCEGRTVGGESEEGVEMRVDTSASRVVYLSSHGHAMTYPVEQLQSLAGLFEGRSEKLHRPGSAGEGHRPGYRRESRQDDEWRNQYRAPSGIDRVPSAGVDTHRQELRTLRVCPWTAWTGGQSQRSQASVRTPVRTDAAEDAAEHVPAGRSLAGGAG